MPNSNHFENTRADIVTLQLVSDSHKVLLWCLRTVDQILAETELYTPHEIGRVQRLKATSVYILRKLEALRLSLSEIT
jgi:hypothetical protein